jgi:hypothetical protein
LIVLGPRFSGSLVLTFTSLRLFWGVVMSFSRSSSESECAKSYSQWSSESEGAQFAMEQ